MVSYAEMFALVYKGEIKGYRVFVTVDDYVECYDFQTENTSISDMVNGRLPLVRLGNMLMTKDEIAKEVKPTQLSKKDLPFIKELINQVRHYYQLANEGRCIY